MKKFENGIVIGFIGGKDYVSKDNGDGTHTLVCAIGDVPEIKRSHDQLKQENKQLIETGHKANKDLRNEVEQLEQENTELREALQSIKNKLNDATSLNEIEAFIYMICENKITGDL